MSRASPSRSFPLLLPQDEGFSTPRSQWTLQLNRPQQPPILLLICAFFPHLTCKILSLSHLFLLFILSSQTNPKLLDGRGSTVALHLPSVPSPVFYSNNGLNNYLLIPWIFLLCENIRSHWPSKECLWGSEGGISNYYWVDKLTSNLR